MRRARRTKILVAIAAVPVLVIALVALTWPLAPKAAISFAVLTTGHRFEARRIALSLNHAGIDDLKITNLAGDPLVTARHVEAEYRLRDLLFGGPRLFGLVSLALDAPHVWLVHHRDGSWNVPIPEQGAPGAARPPLDADIAVRDGAFDLRDETRLYRDARTIAVDGIGFAGHFHPNTMSRYQVHAVVVAGGRFAVRGAGTLDARRGWEQHRFNVPHLAIAPFVNYAIDAPALHALGGTLQNADVRIFGLLDADGTMQRHLFARAMLADGSLRLAGVASPIVNLHGPFSATEQTLLTPLAHATFAGTPLELAGGVYDLTHPKLRLGVRGTGKVADLLRAAPAAARLPMRGVMAMRLLVEGDAKQPLTLAAVEGRGIDYAAVPIGGLTADIALQGTNATVVRASATYAHIVAVVRGNVVLGTQPAPQLVVRLDAPPHSVPYLDRLAPAMPLHGLALLSGAGTRLGGSGIVFGATPHAQLAGTFAVDGNGAGRLGPLTLDAGSESLYVRAQLERGARAATVFAAARNVVLHESAAERLAGVPLQALPSVSGVLDGSVVATLRGTALQSGAGELSGRDVAVAGIRISEVRAAGVAAASTVALSRLEARAPWGRFDGRGAAHGSDVAVDGRFQGDLGAVGRMIGQPSLQGRADVPLRALARSGTVVAQADRARFTGASVAGVPFEALDATVALRGENVRVYSARARALGGAVVASGAFGNGGAVNVSMSDLAVASAGALAGPLQGGTVSGGASVTGSRTAPVARGDVVLTGASVRGLPVSASTHADYAAGLLTLSAANALAAGAVASADGSITGVTKPAAAGYQFSATVIGADVPVLARAAGQRLPLPFAGSVDARVTVRGAGSDPTLRGNVSLPAGAVNGLAFRDATAQVASHGRALDIRSGGVTVGSTHLAVRGAVASAGVVGEVRAPNLDLADFDDFFDPGDMLSGRGSATLAFAQSPNRVASSGRLDLQGARYRQFRFGAARAHWDTVGRQIHGTADVVGAAGTLAVRASALLPARDPLHDALDRVPLDVHADATGVDVGTWLPAAGFSAPVRGFLDAQADVHGPLRASTATVGLHAHDAAIGRLNVQRADVALRAVRGRMTIPTAVIDMPHLSVTANGSFGLHPRDPLDVHAQLSSPDVGALAHEFTARQIDAAGALSSQLTVSGSLLHPQVRDDLELTAAHYANFTVPKARATVALAGGIASLDDARIEFARGVIALSARAPFDLQHPKVPANAPVTGRVSVQGLDLAQFSPVLGKGAALKGMLDGQLAVSGTPAKPATHGALTLAGGSIATPQLASPLSDLNAHATFENTTVRLTDLHANVGRGTIAATAVATVGNVREPIETLALQATLDATRAEINAPNYLRGTLDGRLQAVRSAGGPLRLAGNLSIPMARIPLTALYNPKAPSQPAAPVLPVAFDLGIDVGRDVRVQSGQVDVGAQGNVHVGGTLAAPQLAGSLRATSGTVSFYRSFRISDATVRFDPSNGVMPFVRAVATTRVPDPSTDVTLTISGLAPDGLNVDLVSSPAYDRSQILGLLVGAQQFGAVSGVASSSGSAPSAGQLATAFAASSLSQQFTRQLLEPLSAQLGQTFGLNQFAINYDPGGGFGANARKGIARNIDAVYAQTFNYPTRQSFGIEAHPSPGTSVQLTFFQQQGTGQFSPALYSTSTNQALTSSQPAAGTSGFSFVVQRRFWTGRRKTKPAPAPLVSPPAKTATR